MLSLISRIVLLLILIGAVGKISAQDYVLVEKIGTIKRNKFLVGDELTFRMLDSAFVYKGVIQAIRDTGFIMEGTLFRYDLISKVKNPKQYRFQTNAGIKIAAAGLSFPLIQAANKVLFGSAGAFIERSGYLVLASGLTLGTTLLVVRKSWFDVHEGRYRIRRLDTNLTAE